MPSARVRVTTSIRGVAQGVGFRPAVYRLAAEHGLAGWILNRSGAVELVVEGPEPTVDAFLRELPARVPPHARVTELREVNREPVSPDRALTDFTIRSSAGDPAADLVIPADLVMCPACRSDITDPHNRRCAYPFTTCTDCGPRYTIVRSLPYDRERTAMATFPLCPDCEREYRDPGDRRFRAETVTCPECGPVLTFEGVPNAHGNAASLTAGRQALADGRIVAVKGIGGFQLAVNAMDRSAVSRLRERKARPHKPLAVMAADLETARRYVRIDAAAEALLTGPAGPIVILDAHDSSGADLPLDLLSPDTRTLGMMLPTSPLHHLLFHDPEQPTAPRVFDLLVMTSGNHQGEPICITNEAAHHQLDGIADAFLTHNREIDVRNDDSVCVIRRGAPQLWRRGRGYAPSPLPLPAPLDRPALGIGADLKNAIALAYDRTLVLAPHVGDLDHPETVDALRAGAERLTRFLNRRPEVIGVDHHPDMAGTRLGRALADQAGIPAVAVQHHHAHGVACLAEHGLQSGLVLAFDGTGLGLDGSIWGAELLRITPDGFERLATFAAVPLPGGDAATLDPVRQLVARFWQAGLPPSPDWLKRLSVSDEAWNVWTTQCQRGINTVMTHAAGRLFDSVSAALGIVCGPVTYEGQPPIRLEQAARDASDAALPTIPYDMIERNGLFVVDWTPLFRMLYEAPPDVADAPVWARAVHRAVADAALRMVQYGVQGSKERTVGLTGGVFMNRILTEWTAEGLEAAGLRVLLHRQTPPNDGCIAVGQAIVAGRAEGRAEG